MPSPSRHAHYGCGNYRPCQAASTQGLFFFQAKDGIRADLVTGVQPCALPILYDRAADYRRAVDEHLFGLGPHRYEALVNLLVQLRQPQLSKKPDEKLLSRALTEALPPLRDRKSTRLNSSHQIISYAVFCLK